MNHSEQTIAVVGKGAVGKSILEQVSQLKPQADIKQYDSKTISDAYGSEPDLLIYAGVPGVKWYANSHPEEDMDNMVTALDNIQKIHAKKTILISTIDAPIAAVGLDVRPYGENRLKLEQNVLEKVPNSYVYQLPALKGRNVVKNVWYDAHHPELRNMSDSMIESLNDNLAALKIDAKVEHRESDIIVTGSQKDDIRVAKWFATNPFAKFIWLDLDSFVEPMISHSETTVSNNVPTLLYSEENHSFDMCVRSAADVVREVTGNKNLYLGYLDMFKDELNRKYTNYGLFAEIFPDRFTLPCGKIGEF